MMKFFVKLTALGALMVLATPAAFGGLAKADRKAAKKMLDGTLYMRMDAPCNKGRHSWGVYYSPMIEISPESTEMDDPDAFSASMWHAGGTYWGIRINDPVEVDEIEFDEDEVEIELEGVGVAEDEKTVIKLVGINSLEDFKAASDLAFAKQPLQDEHDDWPAEIKQSIADRKLQNGMSKRQVFYVTGAPESFETKTEDGKEIEIWNLRQTKGTKVGFWGVKTNESSGLASSLRFEDGKLVGAGTSGTRKEFSLDD